MGFHKSKRPILEPGRAVAPFQTLTAASTGTLVSHYGVTSIVSSSAAKTFRIANPVRVGEVKEVILRSTVGGTKISLQPQTTAQTFYGSTKGTLQTTTAQNAQPAGVVRLVAIATTGNTRWAVLGKTTGVTFQN